MGTEATTEGDDADATLSAAIVDYLGKGRSSFPRADASEVAPAAPPAQRERLLNRVTTIVDETLAVPVDWSTSTLSESGRHARTAMADRHPSLTPAALDALAWAYTYNAR